MCKEENSANQDFEFLQDRVLVRNILKYLDRKGSSNIKDIIWFRSEAMFRFCTKQGKVEVERAQMCTLLLCEIWVETWILGRR